MARCIDTGMNSGCRQRRQAYSITKPATAAAGVSTVQKNDHQAQGAQRVQGQRDGDHAAGRNSAQACVSARV